jgi:hypothetical protein
MNIRVLYSDNSSGMVSDSLLQELIAKGKVVAFFRSTGWVHVKRGPLRRSEGRYDGPERRKAAPT